MARNGDTHVFDANITLDDADRQVPNLPTDPHNQPGNSLTISPLRLALPEASATMPSSIFSQSRT
jgi:hypothetical protein